jgi:hypothetical protein
MMRNRATLIALIAAAGLAMVPAAAADRAMPEAANAAKVLSASDLDAIERTSDAVKAAYASGDAKVIMALHHPDVVRAINFNKLLNSLVDGFAEVWFDSELLPQLGKTPEGKRWLAHEAQLFGGTHTFRVEEIVVW